MRFEELARFLAVGSDLEELVAALAPLSSAQRKALSKPLMKARSSWYRSHESRQAWESYQGPPMPQREFLATLQLGEARYDPRANSNAFALAYLGCGTNYQEVAEEFGGCNLTPENEHLAVRVLRDRNPSWLPKFPSVSTWAWTRLLVRDGMVSEPEDPSYHLGVIYLPHAGELLDKLLEEPYLIENDIWPMLVTEGAGRLLAKAQGHRRWVETFKELAARGLMDRGRLLDVALAACVSDWRPIDVAWYLKLHAALAPSLVEVVARQRVYLAMLTVESGPTVAVAQQQLGRLLASSGLDSAGLDQAGFLAASMTVLSRPDKARVLAQFKLLEAVLKADPGLAGQMASLAAVALDHPHPDVRELAAKYVDFQPVSVPDVAESKAETGLVAAVGHVAIVPVLDADELLELFSELIVDAGDPVQVERALEGVARLAGQLPSRGSDTLVRNADAFVVGEESGLWSGEVVVADLSKLVLCWLRGDLVEELERPASWTPPIFTTRRIHEVARVVSAGGGQLLSLPGRSDGSITATELRERLADLPSGYVGWPFDLAATALRVAPEVLEDIELKELSVNLATVQGYSPVWEPVAGSIPARYGEVQTATSWADMRAVDAGAGVLTGLLDRTDPWASFAAEVSMGQSYYGYEQAIAMWPLMFPHHPELLAAHSHPRMFRALDNTWTSMAGLAHALGRTSIRTGPVVCSALALGLSATVVSDRTATVDALAELLDRNLLDSKEFGAQLARLLGTGSLTGVRVVQALSDFAASRPGVGIAAVEVLESVLPALPGRRDAHLFVDLLAVLLVGAEREVLLPSEFQKLRATKGTTMLVKALRRLP